MGRGLFITGTDTDIGKTYVTALLIKTLRKAGYDVGYYKAGHQRSADGSGKRCRICKSFRADP